MLGLFETLHEPFLVLTPALEVKAANAAFYEDFQVSEDTTLGRKIYDLGNGQWDIPRLRQLLEEVLPKDRVFNDYIVDHEFEGIGRRVMWINARRLDHIEYILLGIRDVTDRHEREAALQRHAEQFEMLIDHAPIGAYLVDADFRIRQVNTVAAPVFEGINGRAGDGADGDPGVIGRDFEEVIRLIWPREEADEIVRIFRRTLETGEPYHAPEYAQQRLDRGVTEYYEWRVNRITLPDGGYAAVCYFRDISDEVRTRRAVARSEARYRTLFNSIDAGFCVLEMIFDEAGRSVDYRFVETNPAFERQTGIRNAAGRRMREIAPEHEAHWFETYGRVAQTGESVRFESAAKALGYYYEVFAFRIGEPEQRRVAVLFNDISERRQAEAAVRESEARLRNAFRIGTVGAVFWDRDMRIRDCNDAFLRMCGLSREEAIGRTWQELTPAEFHAASARAVAEVAERGENTPYEKQYIRGDGSRWWGVFAARRISETEVVEFALDVTDRKRAEEALRASEQRLKLALAAGEAGVWDWNVATGESMVTETYRELFGIPPEVPFGYEQWLAAVHPADRERCRAYGEAFFASRTETEWHLEFRIVTPHMGVRWHRALGRLERGADGEPQRFTGVSSDITDQKKAEAALRRSERRFRTMADTAPAMLWVSDENNEMTFFNRGWYDYTGQAPDEGLGMGWLEALHPDDREPIRTAYLAAAARREAFQFDCRVQQPDGSYRWVLDSGRPRFDDDGRFCGYIGSVIDIHDRRQHEEQMKMVMAELNHRVKNTLAVVQSIARQTMRHAPDPQTFQENFQQRLQSIASAHTLLTRSEWQGASLHDIIRNEMQLRVSSPQQYSVTGPTVMLRPKAALAVHMLMHELTTNAIKHGALKSDGGRIEIAWHPVDAAEDRGLELSWREYTPHVVGEPAEPGFGTRLIEQLVRYELHGTFERVFRQEGLRCRMAFPLEPNGAVVVDDRPRERAADAGA